MILSFYQFNTVPLVIIIHVDNNWIWKFLIGDPLYDIGGRPKLVESELMDDSFAEDG